MADEMQVKPVYLSWTTFQNVTDELRAKGSPRKLDRTVLPGKSGSTQQQYIAAARFLGMVDAEDRPTARFKAYVEEPDRQQEMMREIVQEKYAGALALGMDATPGDLIEYFRNAGLTGQTGRKAMAFFLNAARFAGIPVSSHWPQTRPGVGGRARSNGTTAPRKRATRRKTEDTTPSPSVDETTTQDPKARYINLLLDKAQEDFDTDLLDRIERVIGIDGGAKRPKMSGRSKRSSAPAEAEAEAEPTEAAPGGDDG